MVPQKHIITPENLFGETIRTQVQLFATGTDAGSSVLDVGCGLRPYESFFTHCKYIGIDVESSSKNSETKKPDHFFDGTHIPLKDKQIDAVICTEVLEHCIAPEELVLEMHRVLKPGGKVLITVPFIWGIHEAPFDFRRYSPFGVSKLLEDANFEIIRLGRLTIGIDAIRQVIASETNNHECNLKEANAYSSLLLRLKRRFFKRLLSFFWDKGLRLWARLYIFERIYIDNVIVGMRKFN